MPDPLDSFDARGEPFDAGPVLDLGLDLGWDVQPE